MRLYRGAGGRRLIAGDPASLVAGCCCSLIPFIIVLKISFAEVRLAMPPYTPLLRLAAHGYAARCKLHWSTYSFLFTDSLYVSSYLYSLKVAAISTMLCLLHRLSDGLRHRARRRRRRATCC